MRLMLQMLYCTSQFHTWWVQATVIARKGEQELRVPSMVPLSSFFKWRRFSWVGVTKCGHIWVVCVIPPGQLATPIPGILKPELLIKHETSQSAVLIWSRTLHVSFSALGTQHHFTSRSQWLHTKALEPDFWLHYVTLCGLFNHSRPRLPHLGIVFKQVNRNTALTAGKQYVFSKC